MLNILGREIKRGDKFFTDHHLTDADGRQATLPYYVIAGEKDGPTVCITSGVHGTEYPGIGANLQLYASIDPTELSGTIIGAPICNYASFTQRVPFVNPLDQKNLNDTFPGCADGTITEILCHTLVNEFAAKADFHIDMHSGDSIEYLHPYAFYHINKEREDVTATSRKMAENYGLDFVSFTETEGSGATDKGNFYAAVCELGIPSIQPEIGGIGLIEDKTKALHYNGARSVLASLGMLDAPQIKNDKQQELSRFYRLRAESDGIYHCFVSPGQKVEKGTRLAAITDYHGEETYKEFYAEEDSVILWVMAAFAAKQGDNLMAIGTVDTGGTDK